MFRFAYPLILWALLAVPLLILLYGLSRWRAKRRLARFGHLKTLEYLTPERSQGRSHLKFILFLLAFVLLVFAAARPQFGSKLREERVQGAEMMLVVDISNSMLAEDFEPNRLERTKYAIQRLFESIDQDRVGLVVFAGEAKVQLPITSDMRMARAFTKRIDPTLVEVQGTDIAQAVRLASISFSTSAEQKRSRAMILITDGESHEGDLLAAAERAKELGIAIYTIGIGTPEGAPIQINGEFIHDQADNIVVSKLDEESLQQVADLTGGLYVRASKQDLGLEAIVKEINDLEKGEMESLTYEEYNEQYAYLVIAALVLLVLEFMLLERRNPLFKHLNIFRR